MKKRFFVRGAAALFCANAFMGICVQKENAKESGQMIAIIFKILYNKTERMILQKARRFFKWKIWRKIYEHAVDL